MPATWATTGLCCSWTNSFSGCSSRAADLAFVHREGQKLAKLVESQTPERPAPVISFVARQRDLRELVGERVTGAEQLNFADALKHWEGDFTPLHWKIGISPPLPRDACYAPGTTPAALDAPGRRPPEFVRRSWMSC